MCTKRHRSIHGNEDGYEARDKNKEREETEWARQASLVDEDQR